MRDPAPISEATIGSIKKEHTDKNGSKQKQPYANAIESFILMATSTTSLSDMDSSLSPSTTVIIGLHKGYTARG